MRQKKVWDSIKFLERKKWEWYVRSRRKEKYKKGKFRPKEVLSENKIWENIAEEKIVEHNKKLLKERSVFKNYFFLLKFT